MRTVSIPPEITLPLRNLHKGYLDWEPESNTAIVFGQQVRGFLMTSRSQSQFNPDELAKLTHQGLHTLKRVDEPKVTHQQLTTLKARQEEESKPAVVARRSFRQLIDAVQSGVSGIFAPRQKKHVQCVEYGHQMRQGWSGVNPVCVDCGAEITTLSMLRGATPMERTVATGLDQPRKYVR